MPFDKSHFNKYTCPNPSDLGLEVAEFISDLVGGFHRIESDLRDKVDWTNEYHIEVPWPSYHNLATVDYNLLTKLVVMSHDRMLRVEVNPRAHRWLTLLFHKRQSREGHLFQRMPSIEHHIALIRGVQADLE